MWCTEIKEAVIHMRQIALNAIVDWHRIPLNGMFPSKKCEQIILMLSFKEGIAIKFSLVTKSVNNFSLAAHFYIP